MDQPGEDEERATASWDDVVRDLRREQLSLDAPVRAGRAAQPARPARSAGPEPPVGRHRGAEPGGERTAVGPPRRRRGRVVVLVVAVVLVAALVVAFVSRGERGPVAGAGAAAAPPTWTAVLDGLDQARVRAWEAADPALLRHVDVSGSKADRADRAVVAALRRDRVRPRGLRTTLDTVGVVSVGDESVRLRVVDRRSAYELRDPGGEVVRAVPARQARAWEVVLGRHAGGWRVAEVVALGR